MFRKTPSFSGETPVKDFLTNLLYFSPAGVVSCVMNKLQEVINSVSGRFTSLTLSTGNRNAKTRQTKGYCAKITSVGAKLLSFEDVNTGRMHRAPLSSVVSLRSGRKTIFAV